MGKALLAVAALFISANTPLTAVAQSAAAATRISATTAPTIVDAANKVVGLAVNGGVILSVGGVRVFAPLQLTPLGTDPNVIEYSPVALQWAATITNVYFATNNCSGTPILYGAANVSGGSAPGLVAPWRPSIVVRTGNTATLYIAGTANPSNQAVNSNFTAYPTGNSDCTPYAEPASLPVFAIQSTMDLTRLHPEPLHVK
jgi:hypothetical protein